MRIYLSGKITGKEEQAKELFYSAERMLRFAGAEVANPFAFDHNHDRSHEAYMRVCISELLHCDKMIILGHDWCDSPGVGIEYQVAKATGIPVEFVEPEIK